QRCAGLQSDRRRRPAEGCPNPLSPLAVRFVTPGRNHRAGGEQPFHAGGSTPTPDVHAAGTATDTDGPPSRLSAGPARLAPAVATADAKRTGHPRLRRAG